jgi:hypothetical protein
MNEAYIGFEFIYATLSNDPTLTALLPGGVNRGVAPPGTPTPFISMNLQAGTDALTMNAVRLMSNLMYQIKVYGPAANTADVAAADQAMDALLKRTSGSTVDGYTLVIYRDSILFTDELIAGRGEQWTGIGGMYRAEIQAY